jgi:hypothetical protein
MKKQLTLQLPDFLGVKTYQDIVNYKGTGQADKLINSVAHIIGKTLDEVKDWPISTLKQITDDISDLALPKDQFHAIIEFDDELYGYAHIKQMTLGEYIDLENLCQDYENNMAAIAALLYRPVVKHRFDTIKFAIKQQIKSVNNKVEDPFKYYTIEKYNNTNRLDREKLFESFPAHVLNGALSFFLGSASLYLNSTLFSKEESSKTKQIQETRILESLSQTIGSGGEPYTVYLSPISYQSQEIA